MKGHPILPWGWKRPSPSPSALALLLAVASLAATAPGAGHAATPCAELPPTLPTPTPYVEAAWASIPTPTLAPQPEATFDPLLLEMVDTAVAQYSACWNAADWETVLRRTTPRFLATSLGVPADVEEAQVSALSSLALGPIKLLHAGNLALWNDGRLAREVRYARGMGPVKQVVTARWFFVAQRGIARLDEEMPLAAPPLGEGIVLGAALPDDAQPVQWATPGNATIPALPVTILHLANRGTAPHRFTLAAPHGGIVGLLVLPAGSEADMALLNLPPGPYLLDGTTELLVA